MKPLKDRISKIHGRNQSKDQNKKKLKSRTLNESSRISKISRKSSKARSIYDSESPVKDSDRKSLSNKRKNTGLLLIDIKTTTNLIESTLNKSYSFRRKQSSKSQNPHSRLIRDIYSKSKRARSKPSNDPHQANYMSSNFEKRGSSDGNLIFRTMDPDFKKNRESEDEMIKMQDFSLVIPENISSLLHDESDSKGYFVKNSEIKHHIEKSRTFRFHKTLGSQSQASSEMEKRSSKKILEMKFLEGKKSKKSKIFEKPRRTNSPNSKKKFKTLGSFGSSKFQASSPSLYKRPTSTRSKRKMSQTGDLNVTSFIRNMAKKSYLLEGNVKRQYESPKKKSKRKRYPSNPSIFGAKYSSSNLYKTGNSSKYFTSKYSSARGNSVSSQRNYNFPSMDKCSKGVFLKKKKPMKRNIDIEKIDRLLRGKKTNKKSKSTTRRYTSRSRDKAISPQLCLRYKEDEAQNPTNENIDLPRTAVDSNELPEDTPCPMPEKVSEDIHNLEIFFDKCEMKKLFTSRPEIIFQGKKTLPTDNSGKKDVRTIIPRENTSPGENRPSEESELGYNSRRMNSLKTSEDIDSGGAIPPNSLVSSKDYKKNGGKDRTGFNQVFNFSTIAQGGYYINNYDSKKEEDEKGSKRSSKFARSNASPGQIYQPKNSLGSQFERGEYPFIKSSRFYLERDTLNKKNTSFNRHAMETSNNPVNFSSKFNSKDRSYSVADDENSPKKLITFDTSEDSGEFIRLSEVIFGEDKLSVMAKIEEMRAEEVKRSRMRVNKMFGGFEQRKLKVANGVENVSSIYNINSPKNALENFNNHSKNYSKMMEEKMKKQIDRQISSSKKFKEYQEDMSKDAIDDDEDTVNVYIKEEKNFTAGKTSSYIETSVKSMTNSSKDSLSSREKSTFNHPNDYIMTSPTVPHQSTITSSQNVNYSTEETTSNPTVSLTFRTGTTDVNLDATNRTSLGPKNLMMLDLPEFLYDSTEDGAKQLFSSRVKEQSHIDFLDKNLSEEKDQSTMRQITEERSSVITDDFRTNTDFEVEEEGFGVNLLEKFEHEDFLLEKENRMRNTEQKDDKIFENYNIQLSASPSKEDEDCTYQKMVIQKDIQEKINTIGQLPEVRMDIQRRPRTPQSQSTINSDLLNKLPNPNRPSLNLGEDLSIATENKGLLEKNKMKIGISSCKNSSKKKIKFGASSFQLGNSVDVNAFQKAKKEDEDIATFVKKKATIIKKKMNIEVATSKDTLIEEPLEDTPKFGLLPENSNLMLFKTTGIKQQVIKKSQFTPSSRFDETEEDVCSDFCWSDEDKRRKRELQNNLLGKELYHMQLDKGQAPGILTYTSSNATFQAKSSRKNFESIDSWKEKNDRAKIPLTYQIFPFIPQRRPLLIEDRVFIFENNVKRKVYGSPKKIMKFKRSKRYREREDIPSMTCQKLIVVKTNNKWSISPLKKKGGVNQGFIKIEEVRSSLEVDNSDPEIQKDGRVRDFNFSSNTSAINFISNLTNYKIERTITDESKSTLRDINNASFGNTSNSNNYLSPEVILSPDQVTSTDFKRKSIANGIEKNRKISEFSVLPNPPIIATTPFKKDESVPVPHHVNSSVTESQVIKHRETYDFDDKTEYVELSYRRDGQLTENSSIIGNSSNFKSEKFDQICEDKFFRERQVSAKKLIDQRRRTVAESSPDLKNVVSKVSVRNGENIDVLPQMQRVKRVKTSSDLHQNISLIPEKKKKKSKSKKKKRLRKKNSKKKIKDIFGERSRNKPKRSKTNVSKEKIVNSLKLRKQKKSKVRSTKNIPKSKIINISTKKTHGALQLTSPRLDQQFTSPRIPHGQITSPMPQEELTTPRTRTVQGIISPQQDINTPRNKGVSHSRNFATVHSSSVDKSGKQSSNTNTPGIVIHHKVVNSFQPKSSTQRDLIHQVTPINQRSTNHSIDSLQNLRELNVDNVVTNKVIRIDGSFDGSRLGFDSRENSISRNKSKLSSRRRIDSDFSVGSNSSRRHFPTTSSYQKNILKQGIHSSSIDRSRLNEKSGGVGFSPTMGKISRNVPYIQMANVYNTRVSGNSNVNQSTSNLSKNRKLYKINPSQQSVGSKKLVITSARTKKNDSSLDRSDYGNWSERDSNKLRLKSRGTSDWGNTFDFSTPVTSKLTLFNKKFENLSSSNLNLSKNYQKDKSYTQQSNLTPIALNSSRMQSNNILKRKNFFSRNVGDDKSLNSSNRSIDRRKEKTNDSGNTLSTTLKLGNGLLSKRTLDNRDKRKEFGLSLGLNGRQGRKFVINQQYLDFGDKKKKKGY